MRQERRYPGQLYNVVDGDTYDLVIDLGFRMTFRDRFRHAFVDTPEVRGVQRPDGLAATEAVEDWFRSAMVASAYAEWPLEVATFKDDARGKYGRWLCEVWNAHDKALGDHLVDLGHVKR